jgi:hypothetical protein
MGPISHEGTDHLVGLADRLNAACRDAGKIEAETRVTLDRNPPGRLRALVRLPD